MTEAEIDLDFLNACLREAGALALAQYSSSPTSLREAHSVARLMDK